MNSYLITIILLSLSNIFMTFAWYGHLRNLSQTPWIIAAFASWGIALLEYLLQVPANRIGHQVMNVGQLKILQECIALSVFMPIKVNMAASPALIRKRLIVTCCKNLTSGRPIRESTAETRI